MKEHETTSVQWAIQAVKDHLDKEWIAEGCETDHAFGCASCQATLLKRQLDGLASWLDGKTAADKQGEEA